MVLGLSVVLVKDVTSEHTFFFFFSSRSLHTRFDCDWSSDVCSSDLRPTEPDPERTFCRVAGRTSVDSGYLAYNGDKMSRLNRSEEPWRGGGELGSDSEAGDLGTAHPLAGPGGVGVGLRSEE